MPAVRYAQQHCAVEWAYASGIAYDDPSSGVELDVVFADDAGRSWRVPAYWAGGQEWRVRYAAPAPGRYIYRTVCSDAANPDLHGQSGTLEVAPYTGDNPLLRHGPLRVSADHRRLEHADGTPFLWLGDTWWMGLCRRLAWPDEFQRLTADRVAKGFSIIQIVAGLYPDMPAFDPRGFNEAGHPWEPGYARINPAYFDMADLRLQWLVRQGLVPCILGCWGYHLPWLGIERMKQHWRYLVARYGAYPVVWCLAGEGAMPYYLSQTKEEDRAALRRGWTAVGRYLRAIDPYHHPVTIHPTDAARNQVEDDGVLDLDMLQTGHGGYDSVANTLAKVRAAVTREPRMPVVNGEVNYEGILEGSRQEMQRLLFWLNMLSGAAGFTYGANGLWQVNREEEPYGPSPHGAAWGDVPWSEAYRLPGSAHVGVGKRVLERYPFWRLEGHPEWVEPHAELDQPLHPVAAGIPDTLRIIYFPRPVLPWGSPTFVKGLEAGATYRGTLIDPRNGEEHPLGEVRGDANGDWRVPVPPKMIDWVLVLEREDGAPISAEKR